MIDLHTHSTASDGSMTPAALMEHAAANNIKAIALTDHDTIAGIDEAQKKAQEIGIEFVAGIEISVDWPTGEFHLLGLGIQKPSKELLSLIQFLQDERDNRNRKIIEKLNENNIKIDYDEMVEMVGSKNIGRPHFAHMMMEKGYIRHRQDAFNQYLAKDRPCYVEKVSAPLEDAVKAIKSSGAIPVQAHPLSMYVSWGKMDDTMIDIQSRGVEGLEAWHPGTRVSEGYKLESLAEKLNMIATAGSDFHGADVRADRKIGHTAGKSKIEDKFYFEQLKPALEKLKIKFNKTEDAHK